MGELVPRQRVFRFGLVVVGVTTFIWHALTLHNGHNWGGDFAQYILHARNIVAGREYSEGIMLENPVLFPPGFPLLLAPLLNFFGVNFKILKVWNIIFWYGTAGLFFVQFRRNFGATIAGLGFIFLLVNAYFFYFKQNILSDIPFVFFVWAALAAFSFYEKFLRERRKPLAMALLALAVVLSLAACGIRTAGVALVAAAGYYFTVIRRSFLPAAILVTAFLAGAVVLAVTIGSRPGDLQVLMEQPAAAMRAIRVNYSLVTRGLWIACFPVDTKFMQALYRGMIPVLNGAAIGFYIGLCVLFVKKSFSRTLTIPEAFCFFYGGMLFLLSAFDNTPWEFIRFLLPIGGLGAFSLTRTAFTLGDRMSSRLAGKDVFPRFIKAGLIVMILANAGTLWVTSRPDDDVLFRQENQELFDWVKTNIPPEEHYIFWHPRPLALMTERVGTDRWNHPSQRGQLVQRIATLNIRFLLLDRSVDADLLAALDAGYFSADEVWQNSRYRAFRVK